MNNLQGIDVSNWNPNTNWAQVQSSGISFAFIKCTEGVTWTNKEFANDWTNSKANGVIRGAYHFFHPHDDPIAQAKFFLSTLGALISGDMPPVMDWETHELSIQEEINNGLLFLQYIQNTTGIVPIIYAGGYYINELGNPVSLSQYPLWLAQYGVTIPKVPQPWTQYNIWQYSESGTVPGVSGQCDLDVSNGPLITIP